MNKILRMLDSKKHDEIVAEGAVFKLSRQIQEIIGLEKFDEYLDVPIISFRIKAASRRFSNGWVNLLEIQPLSYKESVGFMNNTPPPWRLLRSGTCTINLPPDEVLQRFWAELKGFLNEENEN